MSRMAWWRRPVLFGLMVAIAAALPARGEESVTIRPDPGASDPGSKLAPIGRLRAGNRLRLEGPELGRIEGVLLGGEWDTLVLRRDTAIVSVPLASVDGVWVDRSAWKKGAKTGALIGGVAGGLAYGTLYILLTQRWYNDPPDEYELGWHLASVTMGAVGSGIVGGLIGAGFGALTRTWDPLYRPYKPDPSGTESPTPHRSTPFGESHLRCGAAWTPVECTTGTSPYLKFNVYATPWRRFAFGPEIGGTAAPLGHERASTPGRETGEDRLFHAGVNGRFKPVSGKVQPYLFISPSYYYWSTHYVGLGTGAGVEVAWGGRVPAIGVECAWHEPLSDPGEYCSQRILTTSVGARFASW